MPIKDVRTKIKTFSLVAVLCCAGCLNYSSQLPLSALASPRKTAQRIDQDLQRAKESENKAKDNASLSETIGAYEQVLAYDPENEEALRYLGHLYLLQGDAYSRKKSEMKALFIKALQANERLMSLRNPAFRKKVESGATVWDAAYLLTEQDMQAMHFWVTGVFYYYKDCLGFFGQVINYRWVKRAKLVMDRMAAIDPDWGDGMLYFNFGCYYLSIPETIGGDRLKAREYFDKAVALGKDIMVSRWGRAKYFHQKMNDFKEQTDDFRWVARQHIEDYKDPPAWKYYFVADAEEHLKKGH